MLLFILLSISISDSVCEEASNCEICFSSGTNQCGWCVDTKSCLPMNSEKPANGTCTEWKSKFDMECHLDSVSPLPDGARIGIVVFSSIVAIATAVFWICIFPMCSTSKIEEDPHQDYQLH